MLAFQKEGFLEVEDSQIEELYHTRTLVDIEAPGKIPFSLKCTLCRCRFGDSSAYYVAFHCRSLKRALLFGCAPSVNNPDTTMLLRFLQEHGKAEPVLRRFCHHLRQRRSRALRSFLKTADRLLDFWPPAKLASSVRPTSAQNAA